MLKMYRAEVLGKLPVVQHFFFGSFLPYDGPVLPNTDTNGHGHHTGEDEGCGHVHAPTGRQEGWGDCCGIPVPSAFGAAAAAAGGERMAGPGAGPRLEGPAIRPVPFD